MMRDAAGRREDDFVGNATMEPDGTLLLTLFLPESSGMRGSTQRRYAPDDPFYRQVADHVGPVPVGGTVAVRPFP